MRVRKVAAAWEASVAAGHEGEDAETVNPVGGRSVTAKLAEVRKVTVAVEARVLAMGVEWQAGEMERVAGKARREADGVRERLVA